MMMMMVVVVVVVVMLMMKMRIMMTMMMMMMMRIMRMTVVTIMIWFCAKRFFSSAGWMAAQVGFVGFTAAQYRWFTARQVLLYAF